MTTRKKPRTGRPPGPPRSSRPEWVNADILRMTDSIRAQFRAINDDELLASERRVALLRAAVHLDLAYAELEMLPDVKTGKGFVRAIQKEMSGPPLRDPPLRQFGRPDAASWKRR